jgi:hypothetical protein
MEPVLLDKKKLEEVAAVALEKLLKLVVLLDNAVNQLGIVLDKALKIVGL